jgi:hypothetical protein
VILQQLDMVERAFDQRLGAGLAVFLEQVLFQAPGVDPDADRAAIGLGGADHFGDPLRGADIARIDAQAGGALVGRLQRALVVEMDVRDDRHLGGTRTILSKCRVASSVGQETRMMSAPTSSQRRIWSIVALTSSVGVLVMVWTLIGASPPTGTLPIMIWRLLRRSISRQGRREDMVAI